MGRGLDIKGGVYIPCGSVYAAGGGLDKQKGSGYKARGGSGFCRGWK